MARLFPEWSEISNFKQKPTEGELHLYKFLGENLDDSYEVYFQPFINGDRPDIILVRPNAGVMIIEVKDWHLKHYKLDAHKNWLVTQDQQNWSQIKSPISQVIAYKENLYNLHIEHLLEKKINNSQLFAVVTCAIYFHCESRDRLYQFLTEGYTQDEKYLKFLAYQELLGHDSLTKANFQNILRKRYLHQPSKLFDEILYKSFKRHLQPPTHAKEEGKPLTYTKRQEELSFSKPAHQKIKGVAGSGKTYVLAKRAVNALKRIQASKVDSQPSILILTYNITLKNYIHDRLSEVREDFKWNFFHITNYHEFITGVLNNLGIEIKLPEDFGEWNSEKREQYFNKNWYGNINLFRQFKDEIFKYSAVFIDEIQDYHKDWVQIIRECFLNRDGEYVAFGDEKQNVYERDMESDKKPYTGVGGNWNSLDCSYRLSSKIADLANDFQNYFFQQKYDIDVVETAKQLELIQQSEIIEYIPVNQMSSGAIFDLIHERLEKHSIHQNDICILSRKIEMLRSIDLCARVTGNFKTTTTFETQEIYLKLLMQLNINNVQLAKKLSFFKAENDQKSLDLAIFPLSYSYFLDRPTAVRKLREYLEIRNLQFEQYQEWYQDMQCILDNLATNDYNKNRFQSELEKVRKYKKFNYWMNSGKIKLSTIHSYKGWEVDTLFLIINENHDGNFLPTDELIYTAMTRCRKNLFIIDCNQSRYKELFKQYC